MSPASLLPQHTSCTAGLSSTLTPARANGRSSNPVRQLQAKPEAEREAKGETSLLAEPCADLAALWNGAGGRTTQLKETPLRLSAFAPLRFCLFVFVLVPPSAEWLPRESVTIFRGPPVQLYPAVAPQR